MQITSIDMPLNAEYGDGLQHIEMNRIGRTVVIAGENGSGKSRLLSRLYLYSTLHRTTTSSTIRLQLPDYRQRLIPGAQNKIEHKQYSDVVSAFEKALYLRDGIQLDLPQDQTLPKIMYFVPKDLALEDPQQLAPKRSEENAEKVKSQGVVWLKAGTLAYMQILQNRYREATHQGAIHTPKEIEKTVSDYESLQLLIKHFLGVALTRSIDGHACLFQLPLGASAFSDGQKILLQFCVAIHAQGGSLDNLIVLMDEPENHLHPSAMLDAIDAIRKGLPNGQLWIATHSIPMLSHFDASSIWWMSAGRIEHAGSVPQKVLEGLLGDEERILKLSDFLNLPFELASTRFAYQSLLSPEVVMTESNDKQSMQIGDVLKRFDQREKVRILDFGAGKGRLSVGIKDIYRDGPLTTWLDYIAFDQSDSNGEECRNAIATIYGSAEKRYFNNNAELLAEFDEGSFDAVVMCNVLHEIEPREWLSLFSMASPILKLLKKEGFLLIVEDNQLPVGEKPHQKGFLVLDTAQIKTLFSIKENDKQFKIYSQKAGRLKAHEIPREYLTRISAESRQNAIDGVCQAAKENIKLLREKDGTYQNGRLHGFWVQQFANAQLVLDENKK